jgi:hypothetical protein
LCTSFKSSEPSCVIKILIFLNKTRAFPASPP